jgi:hypothetical protein
VARSPYVTDVGVAREQPVQFSHEHHVNGLGIDCRYCHNSVEVSPYAGMPPTHTCMSCHSQIWNDSPALAPVRESYLTGQPIVWNRVHRVPEYVYFNHSIHVNKGVGCATCHGQIDQMPLVWKAESMTMEWCLDCHRAPEKELRPLDQIYNIDWVAEDQETLGLQLKEEYHVANAYVLTQCYVCHR